MRAVPGFTIREVELFERPVVLRIPFRFGNATLTQCPEAFVRARIELADGTSAWGAAAEMLAPKWFDKNPALGNEQNFEQLRDVLATTRDAYLADASPATAFGHFSRNHDVLLKAASAKGYNALLAGYGPALVDRAVLDALCRSMGVSFNDALRSNTPGIRGALGQTGEPGASTAFAPFDFDRLLRSLRPAQSIDARHTVGMLDAITANDLATRVDDGLPETLEQVVATYGNRYFKLKVGGQLAADLARLESIAAVLDRATAPYWVTLDGNEQYANAEAIAELTSAVRRSASLQRLWHSTLFIEQPIARNVAFDTDLWRVDLGKPVIIDESDGTLDAFERARACGYAGISSKTCKGLYKSILNTARCAAWNAEQDAVHYFMSGEDLTTQAGLSVQQDLALVALLGITHVERNGHHYVNGMAALSSSEQDAFLSAHPDLYERSHGAVRLKIRDGRIDIRSLECIGYASAAMPDFTAMSSMA